MIREKAPLITVIIPTYNYGRFIGETISSILAQTYENLEVIVVDDGSKDNTRQIVESFGEGVRYIYQENAGVSAARNNGIRNSKGEFIAMLDADDIWLPYKLDKQMEFFEKNPSVGVVCCQTECINKDGEVLSRRNRKDHPDRKKLYEDLLFHNRVGGGSVGLIKKECFDKVGLFDERPEFKAVEDWDMWIKLAKIYHIRMLQEVLVQVRAGDYNLSSVGNADKMLANELAVVNKHLGSGFSFKKCVVKGHRYLIASWAFDAQGEKQLAWKCLGLSFLNNPFNIFSINFLKRLGCLLSGKVI